MDKYEIKRTILHICPDYLHTKLYHKLIGCLKDSTENVVYVSQNDAPVTGDYPVVFTGRDFSVIDRVLFFGKQKVIFNDLEKKCLLKGVDIVHAHNLFSAGYAAYKIFKKQGIPYVVAVRNTDVNTFFQYMVHLRPIGVKILSCAAAVVFISPAYKKTVLKKYVPVRYRDAISRKSFVVPNGIDELFLTSHPQSQKSINGKSIKLIYVGEVNNNKNLITTLKACELLSEKGYIPSIKVVGKITDSRLSYIKDNPYVEYHAHCNKEEVIEYYRQSDIFVMPSLKETFGLVYAEALSQGLPIVYSKGQGIDGYFEEGKVGYHVNSKSAEEVACAIENIIAGYDKLSEDAIESAKAFSWDRIAAIYKKMYEQIITKQNLEVMEYQRCTRCVMDNASDDTITFDAQGNCNYCNDVLKRRDSEYFPNEEGRRKLEQMLNKLRGG